MKMLPTLFMLLMELGSAEMAYFLLSPLTGGQNRNQINQINVEINVEINQSNKCRNKY